MNEFELIDRYFRHGGFERSNVRVGVGDDAAVLQPDDQAMVVCTDTLVQDVHFSSADAAADIGFKSLAVNLSDLAAMGAEPVWAMLNLTIPRIDESWISEFCRGFDELARQYEVALVGGDTTRGALTISVQTGGRVPPGLEIRRSGARSGQKLFLSAPIGDGVLGLKVSSGQYRPSAQDTTYLLQRLRRPRPAVHTGMALRGLAAAAIDVSDGLLADLGHILDASGGLGAELEINDACFSQAAHNFLAMGGDPAELLCGGDDYVLIFSVDPSRIGDSGLALLAEIPDPIPFGTIVGNSGIRINGRRQPSGVSDRAGFAHFAGAKPFSSRLPIAHAQARDGIRCL